MRLKIMAGICLLVVLMSACGGDDDKPEVATNTPLPPTPTATIAPSPHPSMTFESPDLVESENPAIELLAAPSGRCVNEDETFSTIIGFDARQYLVSTSNYVQGVFENSDGSYRYEFGTMGEGRDGEQGVGFYPSAYAFEDNTVLQLTVTVYKSNDMEGEISSVSRLRYNCSTGEIIEQAFERY